MMHLNLVILLSLCIAPIATAQTPCACCSAEFRQFDFWLGNWEVYDSTGTLLGRNTIDIIQDSCVLRERWVSAQSAFTGTSYNFYDRKTQTWNQTWVDNQGSSLLLRGGLSKVGMQLTSEATRDKNGNPVVNRITWTPRPDGTVRQHWQSRTDEGPWITVFDGIYEKRR